jgi:hypothetical protein
VTYDFVVLTQVHIALSLFLEKALPIAFPMYALFRKYSEQCGFTKVFRSKKQHALACTSPIFAFFSVLQGAWGGGGGVEL